MYYLVGMLVRIKNNTHVKYLVIIFIFEGIKNTLFFNTTKKKNKERNINECINVLFKIHQYNYINQYLSDSD